MPAGQASVYKEPHAVLWGPGCSSRLTQPLNMTRIHQHFVLLSECKMMTPASVQHLLCLLRDRDHNYQEAAEAGGVIPT